MSMKQTAIQKRWQAVLDDSQTPAELKAQARAKLGIGPEPVVSFVYDPSLDSVVENYPRWTSTPDPEAEQVDPIATRVRQAIIGLTVLGGSTIPEWNEADAAIVLTVYARCKSEWMRDRCRAALRTVLDLPLHGVSIAPELKLRIEEALA